MGNMERVTDGKNGESVTHWEKMECETLPWRIIE